MRKHDLFTAKYVLIVGALSFYTATYGHIKPTNAKEYNVAVFFLQSFGTIGSDGAGNPPDPAWQMAVGNDTETPIIKQIASYES